MSCFCRRALFFLVVTFALCADARALSYANPNFDYDWTTEINGYHFGLAGPAYGDVLFTEIHYGVGAIRVDLPFPAFVGSVVTAGVLAITAAVIANGRRRWRKGAHPLAL